MVEEEIQRLAESICRLGRTRPLEIVSIKSAPLCPFWFQTAHESIIRVRHSLTRHGRLKKSSATNPRATIFAHNIRTLQQQQTAHESGKRAFSNLQRLANIRNVLCAPRPCVCNSIQTERASQMSTNKASLNALVAGPTVHRIPSHSIRNQRKHQI